MPKVSIITISYNNEKGLKKTLQSVISQHFSDYEYIVIDGGSTDSSKDLLKSSEGHISYWVSEPDQGVYHAMNKGLEVAKGEYLLFLNSGDYFTSESVLESVFSREYIYPFIRTVQLLDYGDGSKEVWFNLGDRDVTLYDMFTSTMLHQATFIRRDMFEKYGLYDENLKIVADWKLFLKAIIAGEKTHFVDVQSVYFEMGGISTDSSYGKIHYQEREQVLRELMPVNMLTDYRRLKSLERYSRTTEFLATHPLYLNLIRLFRKIYQVLKLK